MKLISFEKCTLLRLGVLARQQGQLYLPDLIQALGAKFQFVTSPEMPSGEDNSSLQFFHGRFEKIAIDALAIYNDGIVIKSLSNTSHLDEFASFLERWAKDEFGVEFFPSQAATSIYESNVIVQSESEVASKVFPKLARIARSLKAKLANDSKMSASFGFSGLSLGVESCQIENFKPAPFRFERKVGSEPKLGFYFSSAPLSTTSHLELLNELETFA